MAEQKLKGKKVAILAADMFERVELEKPRKALEDAGAKTEIISIHDGEIQGFDHFDPSKKIKVDRTVEEVSVEGGRAVIATPTCPLRPLVARRPEAAEIDRGMWAGLVERGLVGVRAESVRCETADCLDEHRSCRVVLELAQEASASGETASR